MTLSFIEKLDAAEKKADYIIDEAKKHRKNLLTKARDAAEEELKVFAVEQDRQYKAVVAENKEDDATKELEAATSAELSAVESDFTRNRYKTVEYVVDKVLDVPLVLTSTQRQALIADSGRPAPAPAEAAPVKAAPKPVKKAPAPVQPKPAPVPEPVPQEEPAPEEPAPVEEPPAEEPPAEEPPAEEPTAEEPPAEEPPAEEPPAEEPPAEEPPAEEPPAEEPPAPAPVEEAPAPVPEQPKATKNRSRKKKNAGADA